MNRLLVVALLTVISSFPILGQSPDTKIEKESKTQDEAAIRKLMEDLAAAWNTHDGVSFSILFAKDADFTNWRGTLRIHGREEIKKMNANLATGMFRQSKLTVTSTQIRFFAPDVAVVHCDWDLIGAIDYDGKSIMSPRTYFPLFVVTRENGNWSIAVYQNVLLQPLPPGAIIGAPPK
ncbi:MAG TPA: SgcJ/EcaC family oxidoreductase [Candidatus Sulfotelmatobacter sp.]